MNYQETIKYLYECTPVFEYVGASAYKEGLANTLALDSHFNSPHTHFKSIHIAGTNGKGSCSHIIAAILQAAGYRVGLYTSPHLVDFRERIRVNGEMIPEQYVVDFVAQEKAFFSPLHPSFFELTTALAFKYFAEQKVDYAVIEVGLGGRLDCTNIITPILSIITNISKDHTQLLGSTLSAIASEKAGIIKPRIPVVVGETVSETHHVFEQKALKNQSPILFAEEDPEILSSTNITNGLISYTTAHYGIIESELTGNYQAKNANTILCALRLLGFSNLEAIQKGFRHVCQLTGLNGRWQILNQSPLTICDTGHNVCGWQYLTQQISQQQCHKKHIVFGMVDDKDIDKVMDLLPHDAHYYWTQATTHRAIAYDIVAQKGAQHDLQGTSFKNVPEAYAAAIQQATPSDFIFIGGSSYVVADLLTYLRK